MSERGGLRRAVLIATAVAVLILAALLTVLGFMFDHAAHRASKSLATMVPPGSPAAAAGPMLPHLPRSVIIGGVVLLVLGLVLRLRKR